MKTQDYLKKRKAEADTNYEMAKKVNDEAKKQI